MRRAVGPWKSGPLLLASVLGLLGLASTGARAEEPFPRPRLEDHVFLVSDQIAAPFVRTYLRSSMGYAQASDLTYATVIVNGDTLTTLEGDLVYAALNMEYQHAIRDWIALRARTSLRSRLGTDATALLADGVQVTGGFEIGWLFRLREAGSTALSTSLKMTRTSVTVVDIEQFVDDILAGEEDPVLVDTVPVLRARGGVQFAWAINRPLGLMSELEFSYGDRVRRDMGTVLEYSYGLSLDYDISAVAPVPLGVALGFRQVSASEQSLHADGVGRALSLQLAYNTRRDFLVSLDLNQTFSRDTNLDESIRISGAAFTIRYYF